MKKSVFFFLFWLQTLESIKLSGGLVESAEQALADPGKDFGFKLCGLFRLASPEIFSDPLRNTLKKAGYRKVRLITKLCRSTKATGKKPKVTENRNASSRPVHLPHSICRIQTLDFRVSNLGLPKASRSD